MGFTTLSPRELTPKDIFNLVLSDSLKWSLRLAVSKLTALFLHAFFTLPFHSLFNMQYVIIYFLCIYRIKGTIFYAAFIKRLYLQYLGFFVKMPSVIQRCWRCRGNNENRLEIHLSLVFRDFTQLHHKSVLQLNFELKTKKQWLEHLQFSWNYKQYICLASAKKSTR